MAAVLQGNTASLQLTNHHVLVIQVHDSDTLFYQHLDVVDKKAGEIVQADIEYIFDQEKDEHMPAFYLKEDEDKKQPYFLIEFMRNQSILS